MSPVANFNANLIAIAIASQSHRNLMAISALDSHLGLEGSRLLRLLQKLLEQRA